MWITKNRWATIIWHTLLALLMMQLCRVTYYYYNRSLFPEVDFPQLLRLMQGGLLYDAIAVAYGFAPYYILSVVGAFIPREKEYSHWYQGLKEAAYFIPYVLFAFLNISDAGYYPFVLRRVNSHVFSEFEGANFGALYTDYLVEYWRLALTFTVFILMGIIGYRLGKHRHSDTTPLRKNRLWGGVVLLLLVLFIGWGARDTRSLSRRGVHYMSEFQEFPILLNAPISLAKDFAKRETFDFFPADELAQHFTPYFQATPLSENDTLFGSMRGRNIMVIQMESMAREYVGYFNRHRADSVGSYTPFLDSLLTKSLYAEYGFASGKRSIESFPSIYISLVTFGGTFNSPGRWHKNTYQHYNSYDTGLPRSLKSEGYDMKFYHGDRRGMMGFYDMLHRVGVEKQYSADDYQEEYPNDTNEHIGMANGGIHDIPFGLAVAKDMGRLEEPFAAFYFSLSNHAPFVLPKGYEGVFRKGTLPIHPTVQYADLALRLFFEKAKEQPWYRNTLFVLTADHTNITDQPEYHNLAGGAVAPIIFFDPQGKLMGRISDEVVQHTDITPTLLYLLGISDPILSYGHNIFDKRVDHYALNFFHNQYLLFAKEATITMTPYGEMEVKAPVAYLQTEPENAVPPTDSIATHYKELLMAIVQDYNQRVLHTSFSLKEVVRPE